MIKAQRILRFVVPIALLAGIFAVTGPWKTRDEQQYENLLGISTQVKLRHTSTLAPAAISDCLTGLPVTILNLSRLQAGPGITLANPVQAVLVSIENVDHGSLSTVRQRPDQPLSPTSYNALVRCL